MIKILICDDIKNDSELIHKIIKKYSITTNTVIDVQTFSRAADVLSVLDQGECFQVLFLDIMMPDMNGTELAKRIRLNGFSGHIVFITTSNDYACESYEVDAFSYLIKPSTQESVFKLLDKIQCNTKEDDTDGLLIQIKKKSRFIYFKDIMYIDVVSHFVHVHLMNGEVLIIYTTLLKFSELILPDRRFSQSHRSCIVNMHFIKFLESHDLVLYNDLRIPISKKFNNIRLNYVQFIFERKNTI